MNIDMNSPTAATDLTKALFAANDANERLKGELEFAIGEYHREKEDRRAAERQLAAVTQQRDELLAACKAALVTVAALNAKARNEQSDGLEYDLRQAIANPSTRAG